MNASQENLWPAPFASKSLDATVVVPGSKSLSNRYLILAALGHRPVRLVGLLRSRDTELMMDALDAGAEDFSPDGPVFEITTDPDSFNDVVKALEDKGYTFESAEIEMVPQNYVTMTGEDDVKSMNKLIDMLEDNEDVQNVWHNWQQD